MPQQKSFPILVIRSPLLNNLVLGHQPCRSTHSTRATLHARMVRFEAVTKNHTCAAGAAALDLTVGL